MLLVQLASLGDGENGGRLIGRKSHPKKTVTADDWRQDRIQRMAVDTAFQPMTLKAQNAGAIPALGKIIRAQET